MFEPHLEYINAEENAAPKVRSAHLDDAGWLRGKATAMRALAGCRTTECRHIVLFATMQFAYSIISSANLPAWTEAAPSGAPNETWVVASGRKVGIFIAELHVSGGTVVVHDAAAWRAARLNCCADPRPPCVDQFRSMHRSLALAALQLEDFPFDFQVRVSGQWDGV